MQPHRNARIQVAAGFALWGAVVVLAVLLTGDLVFGTLVLGFTAPLPVGFGVLRYLRFRWVDRSHEVLRELAERRGGTYDKRIGSDMCRATLEDGLVVELCTTRDYWALEASAVDPWTRLTAELGPRLLGASLVCRADAPLSVGWADGEQRPFALDAGTIAALTGLEELAGLPLQLEWDAAGRTSLYAPGWVLDLAHLEALIDEGLPLARAVAEGLGGAPPEIEE